MFHRIRSDTRPPPAVPSEGTSWRSRGARGRNLRCFARSFSPVITTEEEATATTRRNTAVGCCPARPGLAAALRRSSSSLTRRSLIQANSIRRESRQVDTSIAGERCLPLPSKAPAVPVSGDTGRDEHGRHGSLALGAGRIIPYYHSTSKETTTSAKTSSITVASSRHATSGRRARPGLSF